MVPIIKKKRYWLSVLLILAAVFILFLPFLLSTSSITRLLVSSINERIPGSVRVGSLLVGWQQGLFCQDIAYEDAQKGIRITIPRMTSTQGLLELIFTPGNLGLVSLESPAVEISGARKSQALVRGSTRPPRTKDSRTVLWDKLAMQLQVRDGLINIHPDGAHPEFGFKDVNLHSTLSLGEIHYDLKFRNHDGQGDLSLKGRINLPSGSKAFLETLFTETEVTLHDVQIRDYLTFARQFRNLPSGNGIINADIHFKSIGLEDFEINGSAQAEGLSLAGGMLGEDTPFFDFLTISIDGGQWSKLFWSVEELQVQSEAGSLECSAEVRDNRVRLNSSGNLDVPILFDQLPHMLHVQEKAFVETGLLEYEADFLMEGEKGKFDFMSKLENLGGFFDGRPFFWESPFTAILHGENNGLDVDIRRLQIESQFIQAFGQGDLSSFSLEASADIGKTLIELNKLFEHPWAGTGELELSADTSASDEAGRYDVESDLNISHFSLSRFEKVVIPNQHFSIVGSGQLPLSLLREKKGNFDLQFALSSWLGEIFLAVNGNAAPGGLTQTRYSTDTNFRLESISRLLQSLDAMPEKTIMGGELLIQAAGFVDRNIVGLDELDSTINRFSLNRNGTQFSDREIRLYINRMVNDKIPSLVIHDLVMAENMKEFFSTGAGANSFDLAGSGIFLHDIVLDGDTGTVQLDELVVSDWHNPLTTLSVKGSIDAGLQKLTPLLKNMEVLAAGINLAGSGRLLFAAGDDQKAGRFISTDLRIADFSMHKDEKEVLPDDDLQFTMRVEAAAAADDLAVKKMYFNAYPLEISADGTISRLDEGHEILLQGVMTPRLSNISSVLAGGFDLDISLEGKAKQSFDFRYRWPAINEVSKAELLSIVSRVDAESVRYKGINLDDVRIPFSVQKGRLQADMKAGVNGGLLKLTFRIDFTNEPALLSIPGESEIITGVQLEETLVAGLLRGMHPLFGVLASPAGRLDVTVDSFNWPLIRGGGLEAGFTTQFDVSGINLDSSALLRRILTEFSLENENLQLRDSFIRCNGAAGRITCSPVRILIADSEMVLEGSVGMDKTLDYTLEVPITTRLVSPEVHEFLAGASVKVPISGTVDRPAFDRQSVTAAIRDLVKQAAIKVVEKQADTLLPNIMDDVMKTPEDK